MMRPERTPMVPMIQHRNGHLGQTPQQWLHKDVFRRIRALSLAKARKAIKPVEPAVYQAFLLDRQGVGPVGGADMKASTG